MGGGYAHFAELHSLESCKGALSDKRSPATEVVCSFASLNEKGNLPLETIDYKD